MKINFFSKHKILCGLLIISISVFPQKNDFKIVSKSNDSANKVFLMNYAKQEYYKNATILDSAIITNGVFSFNIKTAKIPLPYYLEFNDKIVSERFYIEKSNNSFVIDSLYFRVEPKPKGFSKSNLENIEFEKKYNDVKIEFRKKYDSINKTIINNERTEQQVEYITELRKKYSKDYNFIFLNFVKEHKNSYYCFWELVRMLSGGGYSNEIESGFNSLSDAIKNSYEAKIFYADLMEAKKNAINSKFGPIPLKNERLKDLVLDVKGIKAKFILIDFWFSYCAPCISQFKNLKPLYANYKNRGFEIVGISTDKSKDINNWKNVINKYDIQWLQLIDINGKEAGGKSISKFPTNYLLDENGIILKKDISTLDLEKFLKENLKE